MPGDAGDYEHSAWLNPLLRTSTSVSRAYRGLDEDLINRANHLSGSTPLA